jgi:hypothetical protein
MKTIQFCSHLHQRQKVYQPPCTCAAKAGHSRVCFFACCFVLAFLAITIAAQAVAAQDSTKLYSKNQSLLLPAVVAGVANPEVLLGEGFDGRLKKVDKVITTSPFSSESTVFQFGGLNISDEALREGYAPLFAKAGLPMKAGKRYAVARFYQISSVKEVSLLSMTAPKPSVKCIAAKLHLGAMVAVLLEGDSASLDDRVAERLLRRETDVLKASSGLASKGIRFKILQYGATSKSSGLPIIRVMEDFPRRYTFTTPEPLFLEYSVVEDMAVPSIQFADGRIHPGQWMIASVKVEAEPRKSNNSHWDPMLGKPDMVLSLQLNQSIYATSKVFKNTFEAAWQPKTLMRLERGQMFQVSATDKDPAGDDYMGAVSISTDKIFTYEPGQEIYISVKDENGGVKNAIVVFEPAAKKK